MTPDGFCRPDIGELCREFGITRVGPAQFWICRKLLFPS